jgi:predicted nucleic-acid-binding protein
VKSVDTNVLVRVIAKDDPVQTPLAAALLEGPVFASHGVLMETEWVLRSRYGWSRPQIAAALKRLLDVSTFHVADPDLVRWSLDRYAAGADLPDMLHIVASRGFESFASFEAGLDHMAGPATPVRIERLQ